MISLLLVNMKKWSGYDRATARSRKSSFAVAASGLYFCCLLLAAASMSLAAGADDAEDSEKLFMRVTFAEPTPEQFESFRVRALALPTRQRPQGAGVKECEVVDDRFRTPWIEVLSASDRVRFHGIVFHAGPEMPAGDYGEADLKVKAIKPEVELAVARSVDEIADARLLEARRSRGNAATFQFAGGDLAGVPERAEWLGDHLDSLLGALEEAEHSEPLKLDHITLGITLSQGRFGWGPYGENLTLDPDMYRLYGEIFAQAGYNRVVRATREIYENHPQFSGVMVETSKDMNVTSRGSQWYLVRGQHGPSGEGLAPLVNKVGDEIPTRWMPEELLKDPDTEAEGTWRTLGSDEYERFRELMRQEARTVTDDRPELLGLRDWDELEPNAIGTTRRPIPDFPDDASQEDRMRLYVTLRARNLLTGEWYAAGRAETAEHSPGRLTTVNLFGPLYYGGMANLFFHRTPDFFRMGDAGAVENLQVQGINSAYRPGGPPTLMLLSGKVAHQAAARHPLVEPEIMHFAPRTSPESWPHTVMSTLISGVTSIEWYRFGPRATGWEYFDYPGHMAGHAALARRIEPLDKWFGDLTREKREQVDGTLRNAALSLPEESLPSARVGVLWAESSDLWHRSNHSFSKAEIRGAYKALRLSGIPADFVREYMVEDGELEKYDVLFVGQRNVSRRAQEGIFDWVKAGGTLVLTPGAMTREESDEPARLVDQLLAPGIAWEADPEQPQNGGEYSARAELGQIQWRDDVDGDLTTPAVFWFEEVPGEAEVVAISRDEESVNWALEEHGGGVRQLQGSSSGGVEDIFYKPGSGAWVRNAANEAHSGEATILERYWDEPVEIATVIYREGGARTIEEHVFEYKDADGEWREFIRHENPDKATELVHELDEPIRTEAVRFHHISAYGRSAVPVHDILYLAPTDEPGVGNQRPAARRADYGEGQVFALGFLPSYTFSQNSARRGYWLEPDADAQRLYAALAAAGGIEPVITTDASAMDAGIVHGERKGLVMLSNYHPEAPETVRVEARFPRRYSRGTLLDGREVELQWNGNMLTVDVPMDGEPIEAVLLEK